MTPREKYFEKVVKKFMIFFAVAIPIVWLSLSATNFEGDLTRIGKISDNLFAPQKYTFDLSSQASDSFDTSEVLVIGDSFSINLQWQKELKKHRPISIATITWEDAINGCVTDKKSPYFFKGSTIIFESVERNFKKNLLTQLSCINPQSAIQPKKIIHEPQPKSSKMLDLNGQFWVGFLTIINTQLIKRIDGYYKLYNQYSSAKVIPIDNGCDYFSNFFCQYALIYKNDFSTEKFNANLLGKMIEINQSIKDKRLIWIIVPNKYSTYIESKNQVFGSLVYDQRLGPDLFSDFMGAKKSIPDLYQPNDTHLSGDGFIFLGKRISHFIEVRE